MPVKRGRAMLGTRLSLRTRKANRSPSGDHQWATWVWRISSVGGGGQDERRGVTCSQSSNEANEANKGAFEPLATSIYIHSSCSSAKCRVPNWQTRLCIRSDTRPFCLPEPSFGLIIESGHLPNADVRSAAPPYFPLPTIDETSVGPKGLI